MTNVIAISGTPNSSPVTERNGQPGSHRGLEFLGGDERTYANNLISDWYDQIVFGEGIKDVSADGFRDNVFRLISYAGVAPWQIKKVDVTQFFAWRAQERGGRPLAPGTVGAMCSAWRSFQNYMVDPERANEILRQFQVRPEKFVDDVNSIAVRKHKSYWSPRSWALSPAQIDAVDAEFIAAIKSAAAAGSKSLLPLQRDRVMFHLAIHFALRVSELVTVELGDFGVHHDPRMQREFGDLGVLTVTGKNDVTGSIPMREPEVYGLIRWYIGKVRQRIILRRRGHGDGTCVFKKKPYRVAQLLFPSERGGVVSPNQFRKRLTQMAVRSGVISKRLTPHTLRHTGCTLMVPIYSPEVAQKYMRHRNLYTTLQYYHPTPLEAGNEANAPVCLFEDEEED
ncbi:MAG: recombinase [Rhodanobacteraceae bacterium]|nr:MAG: recombinase [Rhodanobacteraceae bacterium]